MDSGPNSFSPGPLTPAAALDDAALSLRAYLDAPPLESSRLLAGILAEFAEPWCRQLTRQAVQKYATRQSDRQDQESETVAEVLLKVTARLNSMYCGDSTPITDLRAYVGTCVYNSCFQRLRAASPERSRLENRIRYLLTHDSRFTCWQAGQEVLGGLARWSGQSEWREAVAPEFPARDLSKLLAQFFAAGGCPIPVASLVAEAAAVLGISDRHPVQYVDSLQAGAHLPRVENTIDLRRRLRLIWSEVQTLPANQRTALLLNLRDEDGQGVIELIPATGIASFDELAQAMNLSEAVLVSIWNDLPFDDNRIAETLQLTRQQVINLRKAARARLGRKSAIAEGNMSAVSASKAGVKTIRSAARAAVEFLRGVSR